MTVTSIMLSAKHPHLCLSAVLMLFKIAGTRENTISVPTKGPMKFKGDTVTRSRFQIVSNLSSSFVEIGKHRFHIGPMLSRA